MNKILIIDGSNLLFQMFYGMPSRITGKDGRHIQGTLGFIGALLKMVRQTTPSHLVVVFDGECENERSNINPDYKANRKDFSQIPEEETPFSQLPDIYAALDFLGVRHTETTVCETDDLIAGYAFTYGGDNEIIISSHDSDFFQLITNQVYVLRYRGESTVICDKRYIINKFGVLPSQYADLKAITGDKADNIIGAEKVGPKNAALLLRDYQSLDGVLQNAHMISKPSIKDSIVRNTERLRNNYKLIKLENNNELPFKLDDIKFSLPSVTTRDILKAINII